MFKFGVSNLRCLRNVEPVELKPLTILVGRNSSGKSTFLRTLPLIRQSIATRTSGPLLWYGDLVDFGEFEGAVYNNNSELEISFSFYMDNVIIANDLFTEHSIFPRIRRGETIGDLQIEIKISNSKAGGQISSIILSCPSHDTRYQIGQNSENPSVYVKINEEETPDIKDLSLHLSPETLLPRLFYKQRNTIFGSSVFGDQRKLFSSHIRALIQPFLHKGTSTSTALTLSESLIEMDPIFRTTL